MEFKASLMKKVLLAVCKVHNPDKGWGIRCTTFGDGEGLALAATDGNRGITVQIGECLGSERKNEYQATVPSVKSKAHSLTGLATVSVADVTPVRDEGCVWRMDFPLLEKAMPADEGAEGVKMLGINPKFLGEASAALALCDTGSRMVFHGEMEPVVLWSESCGGLLKIRCVIMPMRM